MLFTFGFKWILFGLHILLFVNSAIHTLPLPPPSFRTLSPSVHNPKSSQPDVLLTSLGTPEEECGKIVARAFLFSILWNGGG